jgi:Flp pilus assembly protein TadG
MLPLGKVWESSEGSALLEFAIVLPLLVVFIVGIYDFSGAYNQKQKIEHAAQLGAAVAAGQPTGDRDPAISNPESLQPVVDVIFNSLADDAVLPQANQGSCTAAAAAVTHITPPPLQWTYTIADCAAPLADALTVTIDRGVLVAGTPATVSTAVTVSFPYRWRFNSVIQLLVPGASYAAVTDLRQKATVHNQI